MSGRVAGGEELVPLLLAVTWSIPPWRPWAEGAKFMDSRTLSLEGAGQGLHSIVEAVARELGRRGLDGISSDDIAGLLEEKLGALGYKGDEGEQSPLILAAALSLVLESVGLSREAEVVARAGRLLASGDRRLECSRRLAATGATVLLESLHPESVTPAKPVLLNPFDPKLQANLEELNALTLGVEAVARFIANYSIAVATALKGAQGDRLRLLRDLAFLLLEPVWYASVGENYVPPADPRMPVYTVFDEVNARLATILWCLEGEGQGPRGIIAVVDLAGVQAWISESRRLRDLWAASWLASFLAWKAVERLVEEYGPGVLVQPPARLHPFLASKLAGQSGNPDITLKTPQGSVELPLAKLLGLPYGWPVHPTVPVTSTIAAPPGANIEETAKQGLLEAWNKILSTTVLTLRDVPLDGLSEGEREKLGRYLEVLGELAEGSISLEPPLILRVSTYNVEDAYNEIAGRHGERAARALYYHVASSRVSERLGKASNIRGPGRRVGRGYLRYARKAYEKRLGLCGVCGRAPAIIDGELLSKALRGTNKWELAVETGGERLCPYCLVKRLLRRTLKEGEGGLAESLTGLPLGEDTEAERVLRLGTVDALTSRATVGAHIIRDAAVLLARRFGRVLRAISGNPRLLRAAHIKNLVRGIEAPPEGVNEDYYKSSVSLMLEVAHDDRLAREFVDLLERGRLSREARDIREKLRELGRYRAKYTVLAADADFMGLTGTGVLPLEPRSYMEKALNIGDQHREVRDRIIGEYERLISTLSRHGRGEGGGAEAGDGEAGCENAKNILWIRGPTVIRSPLYSFALSRALALQTFIDSSIVGSRGMVIYAGGDDLLAMLPPVEETEEGYRFPAADAARETRLAYWGEQEGYTLHQKAEGFNIARVRGKDAEVSVAIAVAPAVRAFGRSYALYTVDSSLPIWLVLEEVRRLEESKDETRKRRIAGGGELGPCKDQVVVASDSIGASVLPWSLSPGPLEGRPELAAGLLKFATRVAGYTLLRRGRGGRASLSPAMFYDIIESLALIQETASANPELARALLERIIQRHAEDENLAKTLISDMAGLDEAVRKEAGAGLYGIIVEAGGRAGELARAGLGREDVLLVVQVLQAARILRGAL